MCYSSVILINYHHMLFIVCIFFIVYVVHMYTSDEHGYGLCRGPWTTPFLCRLPGHAEGFGRTSTQTSSRQQGFHIWTTFWPGQKWAGCSPWKMVPIIAGLCLSPSRSKDHHHLGRYRKTNASVRLTVNARCPHCMSLPMARAMEVLVTWPLDNICRAASGAREAGAKRLLLNHIESARFLQDVGRCQGCGDHLRRSMWSRTWKKWRSRCKLS